MTETATKPKKTRKPNVGSDPTKGARTKLWQIGFYAFAIGASGILLTITLISLLGGRTPTILLMASLLVAGLSWGLVTTKNQTFEEPGGTNVSNAEPALRDFVHDIAAQVKAPAPDQIFLVAEAEFDVRESTRFFGRKVEKSVLVLGLPYLHAYNKRELAALIAHELAHYSDTDVVVDGPRAIRSLRAAHDLIAIERQGPVNGVYGSYARKMFRSVGGVGVAQEEAADRIAAETYGTQALLSALGRHDDIAVAFDQMLRHYVVPALQNLVHPSDLFAGFQRLLESSARAEDRARDIERRQTKERNEFELHRTPIERIATIESWPAEPGSVDLADGDSDANTLLDGTAKSEDIVVGTWATKLMNERTEPQTWQQLTNEIYSAKSHTTAALVFDDELEASGQLDQALTWADHGDWQVVDAALEADMKKGEDLADRRREWAESVVIEAAAATGNHSWKHSWDGPPELVNGEGDSFDAAPIAALVLAGDSDEARSAFVTATT